MDNNSVILHGIVKRDAQSAQSGDGYFVLDFTIKVWNESAQRYDNFDCRTTNNEVAYDECQSYLAYGDIVTIEGCLERRTTSADGRIGGKTITVKSTDVIIFVEHFIDIERNGDEY